MNKNEIIIGDLSIMIRMLITKFKRNKLDEEYCLKVMEYLKKHNLQGNILRAKESLDGSHNK